jgi:hypothetical protein
MIIPQTTRISISYGYVCDLDTSASGVSVLLASGEGGAGQLEGNCIDGSGDVRLTRPRCHRTLNTVPQYHSTVLEDPQARHGRGRIHVLNQQGSAA